MTLINQTPWEVEVEDFTVPSGGKVEATAIMGSPVGVFSQYGSAKISVVGLSFKAKCWGAIRVNCIANSSVAVINTNRHPAETLRDLAQELSMLEDENQKKS